MPSTGAEWVEFFRQHGAAMKAAAVPFLVLVVAVVVAVVWVISKYYSGRLADLETRIRLRDDQIQQKDRQLLELSANQPAAANKAEPLVPTRPRLAAFYVEGWPRIVLIDGAVHIAAEIVVGNSGSDSEALNWSMAVGRIQDKRIVIDETLDLMSVALAHFRFHRANGEQFYVRPGELLYQRLLRKKIEWNDAVRGFLMARVLDHTADGLAGKLVIISFRDEISEIYNTITGFSHQKDPDGNWEVESINP
jgi:hypothetical protein